MLPAVIAAWKFKNKPRLIKMSANCADAHRSVALPERPLHKKGG